MRTKNFRIYSCALLGIAELIKFDPNLHNSGYYNLVDTSGKQTREEVDNDRAGYTGVLTVGTGTTPPTEDDYKLGHKVDLTLVKQVPIWDSTNLVLVATFKNNTSEAVRITEVAYQLSFNGDFIISRDLITPITIPVGETRTIQYTIEF